MEAVTFLIALQHRTRFVSNARDPLAEVRQFLTDHGETAEGQALRRVLDALISGTGEFDESEAWLFSAHTLALIGALGEARSGGGPIYTEEDWRRGSSPIDQAG